MGKVLDTIKQRRSIRKFDDRPVAEDVLQNLLEAVRWAPSWANSQCWELVVVKDPEIRARLQETIGKGNPATKAIVSAPLLLALCAGKEKAGYYNGVVTTKFGDWFMFDLGIACQNLCLAGWELGLGSVIVGLFDQDKAAQAVGLPAGYELVSLIPMGYPAQNPKPPKRRETGEFTHWDRF